MTVPPAGSAPSVRPADRYGDSTRPTQRAHIRRRLVVTFACFVVAVLGFAGWVAVARARSGVTWTDLGVAAPDARHAVITSQVSLPPGRTAICTVRALNQVLTEVGRSDVVVGPSTSATITVSTTLRTSERATGGGVKACVAR